MISGKYQKQLYNLFTTICLGFSLILFFLVGIRITSNLKNQYDKSVRQSVASSNMLTEVTLSTVHSAINALIQDRQIQLWGAAATKSQYYYDASIVYKKLQQLSAQFSMVPFYPAVTRLRDDVFVISTLGSSSKQNYFESETTLTSQQADAAFAYLKENSGVYTIPTYLEDGSLNDIYYFNRPTYSTRDLVYIVRIPRDSLIAMDSSQPFILLHNSEVLAYSHNSGDYLPMLDKLSGYVSEHSAGGGEGTKSFEYSEKQIYLSHFSGINWQIAYVYDAMHLSYIQIILYIICPFILLLFIAAWFSRLLSSRLYTPIQEVLKEMNPEAAAHNEVDEFQLIKQNAITAKQLATDLQAAMAKNASLISQRFYRDLLLGLNVWQNPLYESYTRENLSYCVILFEFQDEGEEWLEHDIFFSKNTLLTMAQEEWNLPAIHMNHTICAVLVQTKQPEYARSLALSLSNALPEEQSVKIAISTVRTGTDQLHACYLEASRILEYKYLYNTSEILTAQQVFSGNSINYFYPIVTENKLIQAVAEGKDSALAIFDDSIRENFLRRNLTPESLKSFIYILLSTVNRTFQELKTTPEDLLGHPIDFEEYYRNWSQPNIITTIRNLILEIIHAVNEFNSNADNHMLSKMQNYIYDHYSSDIMLNDMADELGISPKYCSNLFKKLSDDTFKNFLNHYRIEQAKKVLEENPQIKITDLSAMTGFNSSNTFIRVFSKYTGVTPGAYAARIANERKN